MAKGIAFILGVLILAFSINAGIMWCCTAWGASPVLIAGLMGVGHSLNALFGRKARSR